MLTLTRNSYSRGLTCPYPFSILQHLIKKYSQPRWKINMNEALVIHEEGSDNFQVSLRYINTDLKIDRQFNFNRNVNEPINNFLRRLDSNISNCVHKKQKKGKKRKETVTDSVKNEIDNIETKMIKLVRNNSDLDGSLSCKTILEDSSNIKLIIFDAEYMLKQNAPYVSQIALPSSILVGFPTYPSKFISMYVDKTKSTFIWHKKENNKWIHIGEGFLYIPKLSDMGCQLKVTCTPRNDDHEGPMIEVVSNNVVEAGPGSCPFEIRHTFTQRKLSGESFRVTSYNILANVYSETDLSKDTLYPYCPQYALSMDYRKLLILKELIGYNADIICLQEVDSRVFENDLVRSLSVLNYNGVYNLKNDLREGLAVFYNQDRFDILNSNCSVMSHDTDLKGFNTVWSQIQNENVKQTFVNRNTIIQAVALRSKENPEILIVGNTHLYFRPVADHIRLLQAYYGLVYLQAFAEETKLQNPDCNVSIVWCGDFNSTPENGVYQLMTQKYIPEDYADWKSCPEQFVENVTLKHNTNLSSACGTPEFTNYTGCFSGCLDYIFYQTDYLKVEQVVPMPSVEELSLHTGLPSVVFPSDHISLCADLKWMK
ncbi:2',5'-phosphodiesterase 12 [Halictus rubicundus]|uniref:2',5'-phosphodiesterase 12 n=1 Tax=Halictus rubicundus TaxID=77578 RepID=UPI004036C102